MIDCQTMVAAAEYVRGTNPLKDDFHSLHQAVHVADCCRRESRFDLAAEVIGMIETFSASHDSPIRTAVAEIRRLCRNKDASGKVIETIPTPTAQPADDPSLPPLLVRGWNFASAMVRWGGAGFPTRSKTEISKLLKICQSCKHLKEQHCELCGCPCIEGNQLRNKLALKTEKCPIGKW